MIVATGAVPGRTGFSSVNPLVERLPGSRAGERARPAGTCCSRRGRSESAWSCSTTTAPATPRASQRCCSTAASEVELVSRWHALFPGTLTTLDMPHVYGRLLGEGPRVPPEHVGERDRGRPGLDLQPLHGRRRDAHRRRHRRPGHRAARRTTSSTSRLKGSGRERCTGSATASLRASSTTRSTRASSPAVSCGRPRNATSTRASSSAGRWRRPASPGSPGRTRPAGRAPGRGTRHHRRRCPRRPSPMRPAPRSRHPSRPRSPRPRRRSPRSGTGRRPAGRTAPRDRVASA